MFIVRVMLAALLSCTAVLAADLKVSVQSPSGERVSGVQVSLFRASDNSRSRSADHRRRRHCDISQSCRTGNIAP